ncbi:DUF4062 domain-containing protein [Aeromonas sp. 2MA4]|uniref:DUF4062 domain-containing protein n=1 Tax=Aeromonas sp. 2MA4 TaxID=2699195 RepID=UPI0023DD8F5B|nr:DUF4062 domain-containing protein [Aeromonas sp. 2MA4]MDF2392888.1 DUF4062 domain-containing protein [Aeromonas sp. 2MA4]
MNKRYQVFVSSTFTDLKDERSAVIQTLMKMDCIPAGMELFPAMDEEQFEFIKKVIDDCDYYLLILGARYGSISQDDGLSYTEKEYLYAKEKGMKIIALIHEDPDQLPVSKTDKDSSLSEKLGIFRSAVCTGRMVQFWKHASELPGAVALSLLQTIKTYPAVGWVRGDSVTSNETLTELLLLKQQNESLKKEMDQLTAKPKYNIQNIAGLSHSYNISGKGADYIGNQQHPINKTMTFGEIFKILSPIIVSQNQDQNVKGHLAREIFQMKYSSVDDQCFQTIKFQFEALGLIELTDLAGHLFWSLTPFGKQTAVESIVIKAE